MGQLKRLKPTSSSSTSVVGRSSIWSARRFSLRQYGLVLAGLLVVAGGILLFAATNSPFASLNADKGTLANGATVATDSTASDGKYVKFNGSNGGGGASNGTPIFVGTFDSSLTGWNKFGSCYSVDSPSQLRMNITSSCNPGGDGHYRVDICSSVGCDHDKTGAYYKAGVATCTSIPINLVNAPKVPSSSWFGFAQSKDWEAQYGSWWFGIRSDNAGYNQFQISFGGINSQWFHDIPSNAWNTLSICANNANDTSGVVYGIYLNGVQQTFTNGDAKGKQTITGYKMINDGVGSWPLSINDYTGGTPVPNEIIHGSPLIYTMGSNGLPPMPSGGWNSPN